MKNAGDDGVEAQVEDLRCGRRAIFSAATVPAASCGGELVAPGEEAELRIGEKIFCQPAVIVTASSQASGSERRPRVARAARRG